MKKILIFIFGILLVNSCFETSTNGVAKNNTKCVNEYIRVNGCTYVKIKMGKHDVYQYTWFARMGQGSDIVHFENECNYCKHKINIK